MQRILKFLSLFSVLFVLSALFGSKVICVGAGGQHVAVENRYSISKHYSDPSANKNQHSENDCSNGNSQSCTDFNIIDSFLVNSVGFEKPIAQFLIKYWSLNFNAFQASSSRTISTNNKVLAVTSRERIEKHLRSLSIKSTILQI